jgi:hypothetical protein
MIVNKISERELYSYLASVFVVNTKNSEVSMPLLKHFALKKINTLK